MPTDHLAALEKVDVCFVLPSPDTASSRDANKAVSQYVGQHTTRMVGFAVVNPLTDTVSAKHLTYLRRDLGLQGVVIYCPEFGCHPANSRAMRLYEAAEELKMPVFFHNGAPLSPTSVMDYSQPYLLDETARTFPTLKIIIGSMGRPFVEQAMCLLEKHKNVYADMTMSPKRVWQVYTTILSAYEREVMDKLLYGSGFPLGSPQAYIESLLGINRLLPDTNLPIVPREAIRGIVERDTVQVLGLSVGAK
ncbi:MAG: amidohydrolase family protein [Sedimentisphaerales bacterium]|nr:amidohydrolase family protein [Sedimentisphaerales bacterium]